MVHEPDHRVLRFAVEELDEAAPCPSLLGLLDIDTAGSTPAAWTDQPHEGPQLFWTRRVLRELAGRPNARTKRASVVREAWRERSSLLPF
jgi:hypothetical protein